MAVVTPRRRKDPEGRMPLREHLRELRRRLLISVIAIALGAVVGWFIYEPVWNALQKPLMDIAEERNVQAQINVGGIATAFNLKIKLSVYMGIVISSPVWLMQLWGFIVPGLTKREKRTSWAFMAAAVPLFLGGIVVAWLILPNAVKLLTEFTPEGASNIISAEDYLNFTTKLLLAFGIAFVVPLLLVALNLVGVLPGRTLGRYWRIAVFVVFLFTAIASPSPDAGSMLAMALPMCALYVITVGVCLLFDRRRAKKRADDPIFGMSDDEAAPLEPARGDTEPAEQLERPTSLDDRD